MSSVQSHPPTPYVRIGGDAGIQELVDRFYDYMDTLPEAREIRVMHAKSLRGSRRKLWMFLSGWLGGPQRYIEKYGHPRLRQRHLPFAIGARERDQWMLCMNRALDDMQIPDDLREGLRSAFVQMAEHLRNDHWRGCPSESASVLARPRQPSLADLPRPAGGYEVDRFHARELLAHGALAVDLRAPEDYRRGHLPGACRLEAGELAGHLPRHPGPVLLYCADGRESAQLCEALRAQGHAEVYTLGGGYRCWMAAGERIEGEDTLSCEDEAS